jgi:CBS domain-containing protein
MRVADAMSREVLVVQRGHSLRDACRLMAERNVGAAIVMEEDMPGPGIVTERDVLRAVARGADTEATSIADVMTFEARTATDSWDLDTAAEEMVRRGFRHLVVVDDTGQLAGILSMRDVVRAGIVGKLPAG